MRDYSGKPSADFEAARRQIRQKNIKAVSSFSDIWNSQLQNFRAMEWYAYSLAHLQRSYRQAQDLFERTREENQGDEVTDWNLACCEIKLGHREAAFGILRERVESGDSIENILEPSIALALEFKEKRFLSQQLDWLPFEEAMLLGYLFAADCGTSNDELENWLSAIDVIASDIRPFKPPRPAERLSRENLSALCFAFIRRRMLRSGITWFRQRLGYGEHKWFHLNWRLLGDLYLHARQAEEAVRCYDESLKCIGHAKIPAPFKQQEIEEILNILLTREMVSQAGEILRKHLALLPSADVNRWQQRTQTEPRFQEQTKEPVHVPPKATQYEPTKPEGQDPLLRLEQLNNRLLKVKRIEQLEGDFSVLTDATNILSEIWPAYSRKLVDQLRTTIQSMNAFAGSSALDEREALSRTLRENLGGVDAVIGQVEDHQLKEKAADLVQTLKRLGASVSFKTSVMRNIEIDGRLNHFLPDKPLPSFSPSLPKTSLLIRVTNRGSELVSDIECNLQSETGAVTVVEEVQRLAAPLEVGASAILRFPLNYDSLEGEEAFLPFCKFSAGGLTNLQTSTARFTLPAESFRVKVGGREAIQDAFFVGVGIPEGRRDIFRGRDREQKRIANSLRGTVQSEVLFLNGPRRVGKTSILNSLTWALPEMGLNDIITVYLGEHIPENTALYLQHVAAEISATVDRHLKVTGFLETPQAEKFKSEPTVAFRDFCEMAQKRLTSRRLLLMVDETQRLADAMKKGRIDDNVFSLFSSLMSRDSSMMFLFTASVLYRSVKDLCPHPIWGRVTPFQTGFLNYDAVAQVLRAGVASCPVEFTKEAIDRVWQMTEGHPWVVQAIGKRVVDEVLNPQQRLTVGTPDIDQGVQSIEKVDIYCHYWWNDKKEEGGFIDQADWEIAKIMIEGQEAEGRGIPKSVLFQEISKRGQPINNERINKLIEMQTLVKYTRGPEEWVRIKGLFLERWLRDQVHTSPVSGSHVDPSVLQVALFVDHENVSVSMRNFIGELPKARQGVWTPMQDTHMLARGLAQHAEQYGTLVHRVAVADWRRFVQDLPAYTEAMFDFSQPLGGKNTSDEKLKQLIRDTLEQMPTVGLYIVATGDADFRDTIQTLLKRNKQVVLWGFRAVGSINSNMSGIFREMETWQNLRIEYLDDWLLHEPISKTGVGL